MTTINCPYELETAKHELAQKRHNKRVMIEPTIILMMIFGLCWILGNRQASDEKAMFEMQAAEAARLKAPQILTCLYKQHNVLYEHPNCKVLNSKYARLN